MDLGLKGQSVLITGASKGIGLATARAFAAEGCNLHLAARSGDALAGAKDELSRKHGVSVASIRSTSASRERRRARRRCAEVDILINNAGEIPSGPMEAISEADWRRGYDLKLFGYISSRARSKIDEGARPASSSTTSAIRARTGTRTTSRAHGNAALMAFTKALGGQSLDFGVRVVGVNPGPVETERMVKINKRRAIDWYGDESRWEELLENIPAGARRPRRRSRISWPSCPRRVRLHHRHDRDDRRRHRRARLGHQGAERAEVRTFESATAISTSSQRRRDLLARAEHQPHPDSSRRARGDARSIEAGEFNAYAPPLGFEALRAAIVADLGLPGAAALVTEGGVEALDDVPRAAASRAQLVTTDPAWKWPMLFARRRAPR